MTLKNPRFDRHRPSPQRSSPINPSIAIIVGVLAASTSSVLIRLAQVHAPSLVIAAYRLTLASMVVVPVALMNSRNELRALRNHQIILSIISGIFLAIHFASWISSLQYTSIASSVVLVQTSPLFVAIFSAILLREPPGWMLGVGLAIALLGSLLIGWSDICMEGGTIQCPSLSSFLGGQAIKGDLLALVGAISGAGYILVGRRLRKSISLLPYIGIVYSTAAVILVSTMIAAGHKLIGYPPQVYLWFVLLALIPQLLAHSTYNWALAHISATIVSTSLLGEPVAATILAIILLREIPPGVRIIGGGIVLIGVAIALRRTSNPEVQESLI